MTPVSNVKMYGLRRIVETSDDGVAIELRRTSPSAATRVRVEVGGKGSFDYDSWTDWERSPECFLLEVCDNVREEFEVEVEPRKIKVDDTEYLPDGK